MAKYKDGYCIPMATTESRTELVPTIVYDKPVRFGDWWVKEGIHHIWLTGHGSTFWTETQLWAFHNLIEDVLGDSNE